MSVIINTAYSLVLIAAFVALAFGSCFVGQATGFQSTAGFAAGLLCGLVLMHAALTSFQR